MSDEILKLAKECGFDRAELEAATKFLPKLEAFYRAAFNAGLEEAATICEGYDERYRYNYGAAFAAAIRALKEKV